MQSLLERSTRAYLEAYGGDVNWGDGRLRIAVRRRHPLGGRQDAEAAVNEACEGLRDWAERFENDPLVMHVLRQTLAEWVESIHRMYSFEHNIRRFAREMGGWTNEYWLHALGNYNFTTPRLTPDIVARRGRFFWDVHRRPLEPIVVTAEGGSWEGPQLMFPAQLHGAEVWSGCMAPGGLPSIMRWLNEAEQIFLFGIVYAFGEPVYAFGERMIRALCDLVDMRVRGEADTLDGAIMGREWERSWVAVAMVTRRHRLPIRAGRPGPGKSLATVQEVIGIARGADSRAAGVWR